MKAVRSNDNGTTANARRKVFRRKINPHSPPTTIALNGIRVHFPFKPYKCQESYMQTVMDALLKSENALLESPTGTGKTLCLLCSTLAWQRQQSRLLRQASELKAENGASGTMLTQENRPKEAARVPTIIYASRTHSQLSQVVRELRNTRYRPQHAVLGSREQMCVNPKVKKAQSTASDINHNCNKLGKERKCRFRNNLEGFSAPSNESCNGGNTQPVMDMEELVDMGKTNKVCPFYYTRSQVENAELVLLPYNYLFDKDARATTLSDIPWNNAVVIFDEAHNLESFASESASFDLSNTDVAGCISEVTKALNYIQAMPELVANIKVDNLIKLKALFLKLENYILNLGHQNAYIGEYMIEIFSKGMGVTHANHEIFINEVRKVNDLIMDMRGAGSTRGSPKLEHFIQCVKRVYGYALESRCLAKAAFYRVHVSPKPPPSQKNGGRTISYWCFAPSLAMEELANLNVRSILVTSGTLSPLPSYSMELGLPFPHTLENPHIITNNQIYVRVVGKGVSGKLLNSSYERRKDKDYYSELGQTLVSLAKVTPAGMLVFFPSYSVMETCVEEWGGPMSSRKSYEAKNNFFAAKRRKNAPNNKFSFPFAPTTFSYSSTPSTPWKRLLSTKSVVIEPRSSADLPDAINEFTRFIELPKSPGCILMGVCRGKISEGIDFANEQSRAVVITGLPFPPSHDAKVKMKREFLDGTRAQKSTKASADGGFGQNASATVTHDILSGQDWYTQQAHRAVNQAIGRVIRNQSDYGAVLLLDSRFDQPRNQVGLSKWLRPFIQKDEGFGTTVRSLAQFFRTAESQAAEKKEEMKRAAIAPILEYEDDGALGDDDDVPTKVALVRRSADTSCDSSRGDDEGQDAIKAAATNISAYVAPKNVVARVDVTELQKRNIASNQDQKPAAMLQPKALLKSNDDVFGSKRPLVTEDKSKQLALQFMEKVKAKLPSTEQSKIRKAIVAMKKSGEEKNLAEYLKYAGSIIRLVNQCEHFESYSGEAKSRMLFLFFGLLPKAYRKDVEIKGLELAFEQSSLGESFKENLSASELAAVRSSVGRLLHSLWCRTADIPLPTEEYLRMARDLVKKLHDFSQSSSSTLVGAYLKLIPSCFHGPTRGLSAEISASKNMTMMKKADKMNVGENSVDAARFKSFSVKPEPYTDSLSGPKEPNSVSAPLKPPQLKRKLDEPFVPPNSKKTTNPYARKTKKPLASAQKKASVKQNKSLTAYLKTVESDVYVKETSNSLVKKFQADAPKHITCPICDSTCTEPFVAECGHVACLSCWLGWLNRSKSCMTCRGKTTKESLARLVYEREATGSEGAPKKLLSDPAGALDDSDDELEIC